MRESYSPLRYPGGKSQLAKFLIQVIRGNDLETPDYVEPYAGGAGAALQLMCEEYVDRITINDVDPRVFCFWRAVVRQNERFVEKINDVPITVAEWHRQRSVYEARDLRSPFQLGFATFFLNRTSRSGIIHNSGPIGGYDQTGNYKIDARFNRTELIRRVERIGSHVERIELSNLDGLNLLRKLNRHRDAPRTFVYLDPPYYVKGSRLYLNNFTHRQHAALAKYMGSPKEFPWLLTYDSVPEIRLLYAGFHQVRFHLSYSAYERRTGEEVLIHPETVNIPIKARKALPAVAA